MTKEVNPDKKVFLLYRRFHNRTMMPALLSLTRCPTLPPFIAAATSSKHRRAISNMDIITVKIM
jgi:hypothetical protein